ncbi:MAG: MarR family transcriptional regulator [Actinomycetota bacterium]|nr:MarR family transcriptional regulator [Actinomycetota bacterium]
MASTYGDELFADLLSRAERRTTSRFTAVLAAAGSTLDEWRVLSLLARRGGLSMSAIALATLLPPPTLTKRVDGMVADGLVYRRVDDTDRRRVLVLLAPRGRAAHDRLARQVHEEDARIRDLSRARLELRDLAVLLAELVDVLEHAEDPVADGALPPR